MKRSENTSKALSPPSSTTDETQHRPRSATALREVINGILDINRGGWAWRMMPHDLPPWSTRDDFFRKWRDDGLWRRINDTLRDQVPQEVRAEEAAQHGDHRQPERQDDLSGRAPGQGCSQDGLRVDAASDRGRARADHGVVVLTGSSVLQRHRSVRKRSLEALNPSGPESEVFT